jgi:hypothetical protein
VPVDMRSSVSPRSGLLHTESPLVATYRCDISHTSFLSVSPHTGDAANIYLQQEAYSMTACYVKLIVGARGFQSPKRKTDLFSIDRGNETALFDPVDKGRIDNPIRIGLFGL